ncbi:MULTISPECIES: TusE/DsrC/DsvC family sulfur relay protein [unclassified Pseudoalteromonas]|uniref:TusE/DsrC/DsvC family sulfur relay protein n=1 Tax=unclassified Pseudoalteromonas TaxID=194690 RepID=UPI00235A0063|nr:MULTISPECIES: TusE/DsrC/DsvC family sulfur relay protein [unclassified Pseudoalteromonas]MDC9563132.1 TusE/DsrC/DsvC family sulfur relay protein [Pseudoalteromonas sp. GAB2316C]MDC9567508.1 TusE/DsrC/DsvC family sulfur relay protein [Pseudoalteromonas sp. GABNB9D]MDC9571794.1 TusE/DsrC/DsvC family sulfur relay protein [Pseudoalteromonas sp. GABNS16A]MDC9576188.1 TusE/DsrC/DsvC family sulfur relay protein [Pseudoalteromonas sp. GABNS16E]MDC9583579.1 TusE/DsrC/DsvC family sulfur relay protein
MLEFNNQQIDTDKQGYLLNYTLWTKELAPIIAEQENIILSEPHWEVINFVRNFYLEYNTSPAIRMLVKAMAKSLGEDKGNSIYLYKLFPKGPAKQATKIAGLPKPARCI